MVIPRIGFAHVGDLLSNSLRVESRPHRACVSGLARRQSAGALDQIQRSPVSSPLRFPSFNSRSLLLQLVENFAYGLELHPGVTLRVLAWQAAPHERFKPLSLNPSPLRGSSAEPMFRFAQPVAYIRHSAVLAADAFEAL